MVKFPNITLELENMDEFRELLQKATHQLEQLEMTFEQINGFEFKAATATAAADIENTVKDVLNQQFHSFRKSLDDIPEQVEKVQVELDQSTGLFKPRTGHS